MSENQTPRTDALNVKWKAYTDLHVDIKPEQFEDLARTLERELSEALRLLESTEDLQVEHKPFCPRLRANHNLCDCVWVEFRAKTAAFLAAHKEGK